MNGAARAAWVGPGRGICILAVAVAAGWGCGSPSTHVADGSHDAAADAPNDTAAEPAPAEVAIDEAAEPAPAEVAIDEATDHPADMADSIDLPGEAPPACLPDASLPDLRPASYDEGPQERHCDPACASSVPDPFTPRDGSCIVPTPWCGAAACGNSRRDTCQTCVGDCQPTAVTEVCDGNDLGGRTCQDLGYAGGLLGCTSRCTLDTSACTTCVPDGCHIRSCRPVVAPGPFGVDDLALTASDTEIDLVWATWTIEGRLRGQLSRFDTDLHPVGGVDLGPITGGSLTVARAKDDLVVVARTDTGLLISSVTPQNQIKTPLAPIDGGAWAIVTAASPDGSVLVLWTTMLADKTPTISKATVVAPDGMSRSPITTLPAAITSIETAVFVDDGFLVAQPVKDGVALVRLERDAAVTGTPHIVGRPGAELLRLASAPTGARLVFVDPAANAMVWAEVDRLGTTLTNTRTIAGPDFGMSVVGLDGDTLVLLGGASVFGYQGGALELLRLDGRGAARGPRIRIAVDPKGASQWSLALRGSDAIAGWIGGGCPGSIHLARIMP
jgi:hypothetical protein